MATVNTTRDLSGIGAATTKTATTGAAETASADRFLKLLVAQMQNQDPLNPMDNAQVTSQMAQINTVSGIEKLNSTVQALNGQFSQLQALQGVSLVGRDVIVEGGRLAANDEGLMQGGFVLDAQAAQVRVDVYNAGGGLIDSENLGKRAAGRHGFEWTPKEGVDSRDGVSFKVVALDADGAAVTHTLLMRDRVDAVSTFDNALQIELRHAGTVGWSDIRAFN